MKEEKKKFQWGSITLISLSHFMHDMFASFFVPILPLLKSSMGLSNSSIGVLTVIQKIPSLLNPLVGMISDRLDVRIFIIVSPALTTIIMSLLGMAPNFMMLAIFLFVAGVSSTFFHTPAPVVVKTLSAERTGKAMSIFMLGGEGGRTVGPLLITAAVTWWGLNGTWRLIPFGLIASFILFLAFRKRPIREKIKEKPSFGDLKSTFKELLPFFLVLAGFVFFRNIAKSTMTTFVTIYLNDKGESLWFVNSALAALQLAGAIGVIFSGTISDYIGKRKVLLIISIMTPILMGLLLMVEGVMVIPVMLLLGFFMLSPGPVMLSLVNSIPSDHPAFVNGVFMTLGFVLSSVTTLLIGILSDYIGLEMSFKVAAVLSVFAIPFVFRMTRWLEVNG